MLSIALFLALGAAAPDWTKLGGKLQDGVLDLRASWVTDSDLPAIAAMRGLRVLDLSMTRITDRGLRSLQPMTGVEELNLHYAELVTDEGMAAFRRWTSLKKIDLRGTKITDTTLEHLSGLIRLEWLDVGYAQVTDVGIERLASLPNLRHLTMGGHKLTDMGLQALRQMPQLEYLDIGGQQRTDSGLWLVSVTDRGMEAVGTLSNLRELRLKALTVTARHLDKLWGLKGLERLNLQDCKRIGDDAVETLAALTQLKILDVTGTAMTEAAVERLRTRLTTATILR